MIGLVIVTHGRLAEEFVFAMEHVVGPQAAVESICIGPDDDMERRRKDILQAASGPTTCSMAKTNSSASRPWVTITSPIMPYGPRVSPPDAPEPGASGAKYARCRPRQRPPWRG